ncbi:phosphodiesterase [Deinococcus sp.]|uniref:phosphodiesterase n=1 Tax=Deinococcus sp. TaxID=47478 RepID=UPI0025C5B578|nr:phosphodiesterase [Deinococcus sp.]
MLIAQLSDTHVDLSRPAKAQALQRAVAHLNQLPLRPDAVIVSGDCAEHGPPGEYALFRERLAPLPMPVYVIPGNHDQRDELGRAVGPQGTQALDGFMQYVVECDPLRLIALDTHVPGESGGLLCEKRLGWLQDRLSEAPQTPTLIFMHHPPLVTGIQPVDRTELEGAGAFADIIRQHPQVRRVVAGHIHMSTVQHLAGTVLMTCSGTDAAWLPDLGQPAKVLAQQQPASCLLHYWTPADDLLTYTSVIGQYGLVTQHDGVQWI